MSAYPKISVIVASQLLLAPSDPKGSIPMAMVVTTPRGSVEPAVLLGKSGAKRFLSEFGEPNLDYGKSGLYADTLINNATDNLTVVRAVSETSKYSGILLRAIQGEENLTDLSKPFKLEPIIKPITLGLTEQELNGYVFPLYGRDPQLEDPSKDFTLSLYGGWNDVENSERSLYFKSIEDLAVGNSFTPVDDQTVNADATFQINTIHPTPVTTTIHNLGVTVSLVGDLAYYDLMDSKEELYIFKEGVRMSILGYTVGKLVKAMIANAANGVDPLEMTFPMQTTDVLVNGETYEVYTTLTGGTEGFQVASITVTSKTEFEDVSYKVDIDKTKKSVFASVGTKRHNISLRKLINGSFEHRDIALIVPKGTGIDGDLISIATSDSKATPDAFKLEVFYKGVLKEAFTCSLKVEKDGSGRNIFVDTVIEKNSAYIKWITNDALLAKGITKPLHSVNARWVKNDERYYESTSALILEDILSGDRDITLDKVTGLDNMASFAVGDAVVFALDLTSPTLAKSKEYKIESITGTTIKLDRPIEDAVQVKKGYLVGLFKEDLNKVLVEESVTHTIKNGYLTYPIQTVNTVYAVPIGTLITVDTSVYKILDSGANRMFGGSDGQPITNSELLQALNKISDKERYPYFFVADSGFTTPVFLQGLIQHAKKRGALAFTSCRLQSELALDPVTEISQDYINLNYASSDFTFTSDWFYMTNLHTGQEKIPMPPSLSDLLAEAGAISTDGMWTAAAGHRKGKYFSDGLVRVKEPAEREALYHRGINTSKFKRYKGIVKFSDLTGLNQETPLQYRSTKKLAMYLVHNIEEFIEDKHFEDYDLDNIEDLTGELEEFLNFVLGAGGVYDYKVVIGDLVNDTTTAIRKLPIYVAVTGKQFIQGVTLGLDIQSGLDTEVNIAYARQITS